MSDDPFDQVFSIAESMIVDDLREFVREWMVDSGWAEYEGGRYVLTATGLAQLEDPIQTPCGACGQLYEVGEEHHCDLAPVEEVMWVGYLLVPALAQLGRLAESCFRMSVWHGEVTWLQFDGPVIRSNLGIIRTSSFVEHYTGGSGDA